MDMQQRNLLKTILGCLTLIMSQMKTKEHNSKWPKISDHSYWLLMIGGSGSGKRNTLLNLINHEPDIEKNYLYAKYPYEAKHQFLIEKREIMGLKYLDELKFSFEFSSNMEDILIVNC